MKEKKKYPIFDNVFTEVFAICCLPFIQENETAISTVNENQDRAD
jgi:hypothetical protein